MDDEESTEIVSIRFNRLMQSLIDGCFDRTCFQAWEVELLLDIESCTIQRRSQKRVLQRYQRAVNRQLESGAALPLRLSEYLRGSRPHYGQVPAASADRMIS
jgi:hypothetical protein